MVFESVVSSVLNKVLGDFVENLDTEQLNLGLWGGDVELKDLIIKHSALDELELGVQAVHGQLGRLVLKVPWKDIYNQPTIVIIEDVYLLVVPGQTVAYDPIKDDKNKYETKKKKIAQVEAAKKAEAEKDKQKEEVGGFSGVVERLIATIIKNVQLTVKNIHIRYEDTITNPACPFAFGVTLCELVAESTDSHWKRKIVQDIQKIYKVVHLEGLSVYWNSKSKLYSHYPSNKIVDTLRSEIACKTKLPENYAYVLGPINASARLRINQKPENDTPAYSVPNIHLNLDIEKLYIGISKSQFRDQMALVDALGRMSRAVPYLKYRPNVSGYKGHYKEWWKFAYTCILEEQIRRRRKDFDWNHMLLYRNTCREYKHLYGQLLNKKSLSSYHQRRIEECEKILDITNIVIIRQQVELEAERHTETKSSWSWFGWGSKSSAGPDSKKGKDITQKNVREQSTTTSWFSWVPYWDSSPPPPPEQEDLSGKALIKEFQKELTPEEKQRLYKAIDYQENDAPITFPSTFVDKSASFLLRSLEVELLDDEGETLKRILYNTLSGVNCKFQTRVADAAIALNMKINNFNTLGMEQDDFIPEMISSDTEPEKKGLLQLTFETNPLDKRCDQRVIINIQPLKVIYDAKTINKIYGFFVIPPDTNLDQIQEAAVHKITDVKERTATGLQYTIDKHMRLDIDIDVYAPIIILPYSGKYTGSENVLVVNLGRFRIYSSGDRTSIVDVKTLYSAGKDQQEILEFMLTHAYDKFALEITDLQIVIAQSDENWLESVKNSSSSEMHLLNPVSLSFTFFKALIMDDPKLPHLKITGNLPCLDVLVTEARLMLLVALLTSIDFPSEEVPPPQPLEAVKNKSSTLLAKYKDIQSVGKGTKKKLKNLPVSADSDQFVQFTTLEVQFEINKLSLTVFQQEIINSESNEIATFMVQSVQAGMVQQTYNSKITLLLGGIGFTQPRQGETIDIICTPGSSEGAYLFKVTFMQIDPLSPELFTVYNSCESSLELNFGVMNIILHQEGLLGLMWFANDIQTQVFQMLEDKSRGLDRVATSRQLSTISEEFQAIQQAVTDTKSSKIASQVETIKFKLMAKLEKVSVKFVTDESNVASIAIGGVETLILVKRDSTQVNAKLMEISVLDLNPKTRYSTILSQTEDAALIVKIIMYNLEGESEKPDMDIVVKGGGLKIYFLNWFVSNMLNFLNQFQTAQEKLLEASQAAAQAAADNVKDVYTKATKMALNIALKAPLIIVPVDSKSPHAVLIDLGVLVLVNKFLTLDMKNEEGFSAVVDDLKINLTDFKVSRATLNESNEKVSECDLLTPLTFYINVKRNLSASWFNAIPDLEISGKIKLIQLLLSQGDYQMIMNTLSGNLAEGKVPNAPTQTVSATVQPVDKQEATIHHQIGVVSDVVTKTEVGLTIWKDKIKEKTRIFLNFTFSMEQFIIDMFSSKDTVDCSQSHNRDLQLARFVLQGLALKGKIFSDDSIVTSVLLVNCILDDMRKGREDKLNRLIGRTHDFLEQDVVAPAVASVSDKSMLDVTLQRSGNDMFADVRIYSFTVILSVDYLMKVADFFNVEQSPEQSVPEAQIAPSEVSLKDVKDKVKEDQQPPKPAEAYQMTINLKIEKPDIVLVEHMDNIDTNALIVNSEIQIKLRIAGEHQVINGLMKDLQCYTCNYNPAHRAETTCNVLYPVTISVAGSTPENKGLHVELMITEVHLSVSPDTIELLNRVMVTLTGSQDSEQKEGEEEFKHDDLWLPQPFAEKDFWYFKTENALEAINLPNAMLATEVKEEMCIIAIPLVSITVEAGVSSKTVPMLILETGFMATAKNWSSQLSVEASLTILMGYYNNRLALWEPLIEPVEEFKEMNRRHEVVPWELKLELTRNQEDELNATSPSASEDSFQLPPPLSSIDISSSNNLELTVTKTLLDVLQNLGAAFSHALKFEKLPQAKAVEAPYRVLNEIGEDVTLILEDSSFELVKGGSLENINKSSAVPLQLKSNKTKMLQLKQELSHHVKRDDIVLHIKINKKDCDLTIPVMRADKRFFTLNFRSTGCPDNWGIISDIQVDEGITTITLRSVLQVYNYFSESIDVYYMTPKGNELELIGVVQPNGVLNVPLKAVYNPTNELFFAVSGYSVSSTPYVWKDLQTKLAVTKILHCSRKDPSKAQDVFIIKAVGEMEQVFFENTAKHTMGSTCFNIHLRPAVIFKNFLPLDIVCCLDEAADEYTVSAGDTLMLPGVDPGKNALVIRISEYLEKEWSCRQEIRSDLPEFAVWTFHSYDSNRKIALDLGMHTVNKNGSLVMALYCPFWMLNKTGMLLAYRSFDESSNILHHPATYKQPILFSFNAKNFFGKKKASVRIENGEWSDKFSIDVAGSSGVVNCKINDMNYQIAVSNQLTYNGLTKQVTFTPYYVIINNASFPIECQENDRPADPWVIIEPKCCTALWPKSEMQDKLLKLRVVGSNDVTAAFLYTESHTTLLRLDDKYGGINVDVQLTEGGIYINLASYEDGSAPALLINYTSIPITFWEKDSVQKWSLKPKYKQLFTWENPSGPRVIAWDRGHHKEILDDLRKDNGGEFSPSEGINVCWATFLDGMQRVVLFTEDRSIVENAQVQNLFVTFDQEITVAINGLGVSLVNNLIRQEILYIGIASSGIIWEACKINGKRFKHLDARESTHLEYAYQQYLLKQEMGDGEINRTIVDEKVEVDFKTLHMYKPQKRKLRRTFQTGLWLQMKSSATQMHLHAKINRLQIDNQMYECTFPVVLAPVPPPKSVAADSGIKPFMEVSIVQLLLKNSQIRQFKYFKVLVQEFHIKVDLGFINSVLELLQQTEATDEEEKNLFLLDKGLVDQTLFSLASSLSLQEQKSFYDRLHFSPLKIHISFSMASGSSSSGQNIAPPNFLNVLLQGLGVTLTDLQDVVFKLAYFERNYTFLTQKQLTDQVVRHYVGQTIKQMYVLVLGLDVLGNPYGLVVGLTKGVEDLFYEPFQGAIQGPGEFAEGLALGVRSLFGHTVGGAAGAMSRITGAMGKGIAALTFDDDYQRKRREAISKKPASAQEGFARSGKGLVMGVVSGVTGVITKPVAGAKEEGVEGFFKGLGKGAVGLVTRPVAGVVDFASGSLEAVKRATDTSEEVSRLRPPRFLKSDGLVRPYFRYEAEGHKILMELSKGKYAKTDVYVTHYEIVRGKETLLFTDQRLAYITHNDLFGAWQMDWFYTWTDLVQPAKVVPKGVLIPTSDRKKKFFGSIDSGKTILIADPQKKEEICSKIESLRCT